MSVADPLLERAAALLHAGEVVGLPTETVYGLAADATNPEALAKIFAIKGRPTGHPLIVHLGDASWLDESATDIPESARRLAERFWPGPLTLILRRSPRVSLAATGGLETVGLRVPDHPVALALLRAFGRPLAAPSANRFGAVSPTTRAHVLRDLGDRVPLVLEGGESRVGVESTIVDLSSGAPRLLRPGAVTQTELEAALGVPVPFALPGDVRAPGTLESHYAPRARVLVTSESELFERARALATTEFVGVLCRGRPRDLPKEIASYELGATDAEIAHRLYDGLRSLDEAGCECIVSFLPEATGLGAAIEDRLVRAAAPRSSKATAD